MLNKRNLSQVLKSVKPIIYFRDPLYAAMGGISPGGAIFPMYVVESFNEKNNVLSLVKCDVQIGNDLVWFFFSDGLKIVVRRDLMKEIKNV